MMKSLISWKSITGAFALVVGVYLFSPLVSEDCFGFSQEVKACDVACLLVPGLVLLLWGNARAGVVKVSAIDVWFLLYAVYLFVRALLVWEETDRGVLVEYVACGGLYVVLRNADWRAVRYPVVVLCCAGVLLWQFWYGVAVQTDYFFPGKSVAGVCGSFFNVNLWSCFVACVGVGLCARLFSPCSRWDGVAGLIVVWILVLLFWGASRAAWLGFVAGCGYALWQNGGEGNRLSRWGVAVALVFLVGMAAVYTGGKIDSANGRLLIWKIAMPMFWEKPWGWGIDGFRRHYMAFQEDYFRQGGTSAERMLADENYFAFNEVLRVAVEQGWMGLLFWGILLGSLFRRNMFSDRRVGNGLKSVLVAWGVCALFSYPGVVFQTKGIVVAVLAVVSSFAGKRELRVKGWVRPACGAAVVAVLLAAALPFRQAAAHWRQVWDSGMITREDMRLFRPLRNSIPYLSNGALLFNAAGAHDGAEELAARGVRLYHSYACCLESGRALAACGEYESADSLWIKAGYLVPNRFRPLHLRMRMWLERGDTLRAKALARRILEKEIKVESPDLIYMRQEATSINHLNN